MSNLGQTASGNREPTDAHAQGFVTGDNAGGYTLESFQLSFTRGTSNGSALTVALWSAVGTNPGSEIVELSNPSDLSTTGIKTFTAPSGTNLAASTRYFVHVHYTSTSNTPTVASLNSNSEDTGGLSGWTIDNTRHVNDSGVWNQSDWELAIGVNALVPNTPPTVTASCSPCVVPSGEEVDLTATASDADSDPLTYSWTATQGSFVGATDAATASWQAPATTGTVEITVTVSDGSDNASATVTITVTNPNTPPTVTASCSPCQVVPEGGVDLTATASDANNDPLTYSWTATQGSFDGVADAATASWQAPATTGTVEITVTVSDGFDDTSDTVTITVTSDPNTPPTVTASCSPCQVPSGGGGIVNLTATASDADSDPLTYSWTATQGSFAGATDAATARWQAPALTGAVEITVTVSDGSDTTSATVTITFTASDPDPDDPDPDPNPDEPDPDPDPDPDPNPDPDPDEPVPALPLAGVFVLAALLGPWDAGGCVREELRGDVRRQPPGTPEGSRKEAE